jgi:MFS family permease
VSAILNPRTLPKVMAGLFGVFFLLGMSPGYYVPALANILAAKGLGSEWLERAFLAGPIAAMVSPLIIGAMADNRFAAQKVFGWIGLISGVLLVAAFWSLDQAISPWWFIGLLAASSIVAAPMWGMLTSLSMAHLKSGESEFPVVRLGGTLGWMAAGYLTSFVLFADSSPMAGYAAGITRFAGGIAAFFLPNTPPMGSSRSLRTLLGLDAFRLLKERDHLVFFSVTTLLSIPLAAFFMHTPMHLLALGNEKAAATMTIGQWSEIAAMLLVGAVMTRYRLKVVLLWALGLSVARYGLSAISGASGMMSWHIAGIALNGVCYTFYFITAQVFLDRRVDPAMKGQAQGLLALVSGGLGPLIGALFCGWLRSRYAADGPAGWAWFWGILAAMIGMCFVLLAVFYRGLGGRGSTPEEPVPAALPLEESPPLQTKS